MTNLLWLCWIVVLLFAPNLSRQTAGAEDPSRQPVDYESFCKQDRAGKERLFARMSVQDRAALARIQLQRWLETNTPRLTSQQIAALKDRIRTIKPVDYSSLVIEHDMARAKAFESAAVLFSRADISEMGIAGPCLPKPK